MYVPYKLLFCDSLGWTYACACSALNAYIRVDFVMGISLSDSLYWTFSSAGSAAYTFVCDYICHDLILLVDFLVGHFRTTEPKGEFVIVLAGKPKPGRETQGDGDEQKIGYDE